MAPFSIIVISYNGKKLLRRCLAALKKSAAMPREIIIVDDCSSDGTAEMVCLEFPSCLLIRNDQNRGPTYSRNRGAELATSGYLVFLDNDILVRTHSIVILLDFLLQNPKAGLVGGKLISERGRTIHWNMGYRSSLLHDILGSFFGFFVSSGLVTTEWFVHFTMRFSFNYWNYDRTLPVGWVIESFNAIRRDLFQRVNGFDENFFMFFEGPDLSERLRRKGYQTFFVHDAVADMLEGHTHTPLKRKIFFYQSRIRFHLKHYWRLHRNF